MSPAWGPPTPPTALEAERGVLGAFLLEPPLLGPYVETLPPRVFHKEANRVIWTALCTLARAGLPIDVTLLVTELRRHDAFELVGGHSYLAVLQEEGTVVTQLPEYVRILRETAAKREYMALSGRVLDWTANGHPVTAIAEAIRLTLADATALADPISVAPAAPMGLGLGSFLEKTFPALEALVEGLLYNDGGGFIGGEEKLGKSYYSIEEALCLGLGAPVCGHFTVPTRRRVLFIEEEDPPRRLHARINALLRGKGYDPTDPVFRAELDLWVQVVVWEGFSFDDRAWVARLDKTCQTFRPEVIYVDAVRKITLRDLNKSTEAGAFLATLDRLRREYGVIFRLLHHYRKSQGNFRTGRGSQELGGSFQLGAWAENSLFFEPIGRTQGHVRVDVQTKDAPPAAAFQLKFESEGPPHDPDWVRLTAELIPDASGRTRTVDLVRQGLGAAPKTEPSTGTDGVLVATLAASLKLSPRNTLNCLKDLEAAGEAACVGKGVRGAGLWALIN